MVWSFPVRGRILTKGEVEGKYSEDLPSAIHCINNQSDSGKASFVVLYVLFLTCLLLKMVLIQYVTHE